LGIGGAEQLILQLALASKSLGHNVQILTTRCDAHHCFAAVKPPDGTLHKAVQVKGRWIPASILGQWCTALCSHLRVIYLALWLVYSSYFQDNTPPPDLIVLDVLPTPLWILRHFSKASLLFYCHFPDKLLTRNNPLLVEENEEGNAPPRRTTATKNKSLYRRLMDSMEDACMPLADSILVNSKFTQQVVLQEFSSLQPESLQVLYPSLDTSDDSKATSDTDNHTDDANQRVTLVSLNRYERKKKIELILYAYALMRKDLSNKESNLQVIIAGGYDTQCVENVEYRGELEQIAFTELQLPKSEVQFLTSISDAQRQSLLKEARCVVYTPPKEHFGIVPLEVMYAGTPVVACNSGGPLETVVDGVTGFLCDPTPQSFAKALQVLVGQPELAHKMGAAGRQHVMDNFGTHVLQQEWQRLTQQAYERGQERLQSSSSTSQSTSTSQSRSQSSFPTRLFVYLEEAALAIFICLLLTVALRQVGFLEPEESILGSMRRRFQTTGDEL